MSSISHALPLIALLAVGCATTHPASDERVRDLVRDRTTTKLVLQTQDGSDAETAETVAALLRAELTADGAAQVALLNNRGLRATLGELGVAAAELRQARLVENPTIDAELRFPDRPLTIGVMQNVLDLLLRPGRSRIAASHSRETELKVAHAVLELSAEVRAGFYHHQAALQAVVANREVVDTAAIAGELSQRQKTAGTVSRLELENMQALVDEAQLALARSEALVVETREMLNRLLGLSGTDTAWVAAAHLPEPMPSDGSREALEARALATRLDLRAAEEEIGAARGAMSLARYRRFPELGVGIHIERETDGETTVGPGIALSLPLFDRGQAARDEARHRLGQSLDRRADLAIGIQAEVRAAHAKLEIARRQYRYYRDVVLPRRARIVGETQREYNYMLVGVYQLLAAKQAEIDARREAIAALDEYWQARIQLERAVGDQLDTETVRTSLEANHETSPALPGPNE